MYIHTMFRLTLFVVGNEPTRRIQKYTIDHDSARLLFSFICLGQTIADHVALFASPVVNNHMKSFRDDRGISMYIGVDRGECVRKPCKTSCHLFSFLLFFLPV